MHVEEKGHDLRQGLAQGLWNTNKVLRQAVRFAIFFRQPLRSFRVAFYRFRFRIPINLLTSSNCDVAQVADRCTAMTDADVGGWSVS